MDNFSKIWMQDICSALNSVNLEMPKEYGGGKWSIEKFENPTQLIKYHVTKDIGIYQFLDSKGLINRGRCPITGELIGTEHYYELFGRRVYISLEGKRIAKEWDRIEHLRLFGKEPMTIEQKNETRRELENNRKLTLLYWLLFIMLIVFFIKKCT